jgi:hypothetical protein
LFSAGFEVAHLQIKQLLVCKMEGEILAQCLIYSGLEMCRIIFNMLRNRLMPFDRHLAAKSQYQFISGVRKF